MPKAPLSSIPDDGRLWIFGADRDLDAEESRTVLDRVDAFLDGWAAHGAPLTSGRDWREDRFLFIAVDERSVPPSGCSIDALVRELKDLESELGLGLVGHARIWYREGEQIRSVDRPAFRALASAGDVGPGTVVFDPTLTRVGQLREGGFERPAETGWHAALLRNPAGSRSA